MKTPGYVAGVGWSFVSAGAGVVLPLAIFVVFARMIPPILIGVFATAVACTEILKTLGLQGLYEALLQQREDRQRCHETASFVFLVSGLGLLLLYLIVLAGLGWFIPQIESHYGTLAFVGLRIPFGQATLQPQAELAHRLLYRVLALRAVIANTIAGAAGILLAVLVDGPVGLAAYQACQSIIVFVATAFGTNAMAWPRFDPVCFRRMVPEGGLSTCVRLVAATINNLDQIMIGVLVDGVSLAYFNLGKRVESTFITMVGSLVAILFQPKFARSDLATYDEAFQRSAAISTVLCGLPAALMLVGSLPVIGAVFGHQWVGAASVVAVFALSGFVRASGFVPGALMSVSGRNRDLLVVSVVSAASGIVLVALCARFGIVWCAAALATKNAFIVMWLTWWLRGQVSTPLRTYMQALVVPFGLMICGIGTGRWIVGLGPSGEGIVLQLGHIMVWVLTGGIATVAYFALFFGEWVRLYNVALRQR